MSTNASSTQQTAIDSAQRSYDEVPYESFPFGQTHPSRLFTVATLFGLRPTPVQRCRVLELGCAAGGNLIPMADYLPDSEFLGIDISPRQIQEGQAIVDQLELKNIQLKHASMMDIDESYGKFDYIISHGVYSWVRKEVQDKLLDICSKNLAPNGVAYVSYNTYPGWHMRGMIRDMMRYHAQRFNSAKDRIQQARALLDFLAREVKQEGPYQTLLRKEVEELRTQADHYLYHEHLEEVNQPLYFHEFVERARNHGLRYLGESRIATMVTGNFGENVDKTLRMIATDNIMAEQYMDFLRNRMFRETLLCHENLQPNWSVNPDSLRVLHVASPARIQMPQGQLEPDIHGETEYTYRGPSGMTVNTKVPLLKAVMFLLEQAYPASIPFDLLRRQAREMIGGDPKEPKQAGDDAKLIAVGLLSCYMASDVLEFHGMPITFSRNISAKPVALALARIMAKKTTFVPNRRHELVRLDELDIHLLPMLDGTNDRNAILDKLTDLSMKNALTVNRDNVPLMDPKEIRSALDSILDQRLVHIARMGVIAG